MLIYKIYRQEINNVDFIYVLIGIIFHQSITEFTIFFFCFPDGVENIMAKWYTKLVMHQQSICIKHIFNTEIFEKLTKKFNDQ